MSEMFDRESPRVRAACQAAAALAPPVQTDSPPLRPRLMLVTCMTPRSGSTYLGSLLRANRFGKSGEHFRVRGEHMEKFVTNKRVENYDEYVRRMIKTRTRDGMYAVKFGWLQFAPVYYFGCYARYFRDAKFINLTRRDVLGQAISRYISDETGYHHTAGERDMSHTKDREVPMDFDKISHHVDYIVSSQAAWEKFFSVEGVEPLRIQYEELAADPGGMLRKIADLVGRPIKRKIKLDTGYKQVRNERNERLREAYTAEAAQRGVAGSAHFPKIEP